MLMRRGHAADYVYGKISKQYYQGFHSITKFELPNNYLSQCKIFHASLLKYKENNEEV
jgi:hypothetical protein